MTLPALQKVGQNRASDPLCKQTQRRQILGNISIFLSN